MALIAQCTGLRVEEVLALYWSDIDFDEKTMLVTRAVVHGRICWVKTEYSEDALPLDENFAELLRELKKKAGESELLFPSPKTGHCYHASPIQQDYIRRAGWCLVPCPVCKAAPGTACTMVLEGKGSLPKIPVHDERRALATKKKFGSIGWHTFRHSYRLWLDETGAPLGVQQKLMRHADIAYDDERVRGCGDAGQAQGQQQGGGDGVGPQVVADRVRPERRSGRRRRPPDGLNLGWLLT